MNRLTREKKEGMLILSLHKSSSRRIASELVKEGNPVGVFNRGVCAIWGDGRNKLFYQEVVRIKGEKRNKKPLATSIKTEDFVRFIDASKIPKSLHEIFTDPKRLKLRIGSLCFMRLPIKASIARELPHYIISKMPGGVIEMQNWDAHGHQALDDFIKLLKKEKIDLPSVTSMNFSGEPEIVDQEEGIEFAKKAGIKLFLTDEKDLGKVKGSFTIISVSDRGVKLIRDGNIPGHVFPYLFEAEIDTDEVIPSRFPQIEFPPEFFKDISAEEARTKIISFINNPF